MFLINPFNAVLPARDKAALVVSRDYLSYSPEELHAILEYNPYSFLHVINPGYRFHKDISGSVRYELVRNRYLEYLESGILQKQDAPALYLYQLDSEDLSCYGLIGNLPISHYLNKRVKPHEKTLKARVNLFKEYLQVTRIHTDPVLIAHDHHEGLDGEMQEIMQAEALLEFTTPDRITHRLWPVSNPEIIGKIRHFYNEVGNLYIADGHHRITSSAGLFREEKDNPMAAQVMSLYMSESQLRISGFCRLVRDLNGLDKEEFLMALDKYFMVENRMVHQLQPEGSNEFTMYLDGEYYTLHLRNTCLKGHALEDLPPRILQRTVLKPILGIKSMRKSRRITYDFNKQAELRMKELIDKGLYMVGFTHTPVSFKQLKAVADQGDKMPPKSTYIEPKLKSALTLYEF